jgi:CRP-like cAMP-binding protein
MSAPLDMQHPCGKCSFYEKSVWQPVEPGSISVLARGFSRRDLDVGQALFEQDDENRGVFCVSKGLIALRTHHANGTSTLLKLAYPGDVIGFRSFLRNDRHRTGAHALQPSRVCSVAHRDVNRVIHGNPSVLTRLAAQCIAEIDGCHEWIIAAATESNKKRLCDLLHRLMEAHGERIGDHLRMQLPLSRSDLADLIGVQPETMSRLFRRLKSEGAISVSGRDVQMPVSHIRCSFPASGGSDQRLIDPALKSRFCRCNRKAIERR